VLFIGLGGSTDNRFFTASYSIHHIKQDLPTPPTKRQHKEITQVKWPSRSSCNNPTNITLVQSPCIRKGALPLTQKSKIRRSRVIATSESPERLSGLGFSASQPIVVDLSSEVELEGLLPQGIGRHREASPEAWNIVPSSQTQTEDMFGMPLSLMPPPPRPMPKTSWSDEMNFEIPGTQMQIEAPRNEGGRNFDGRRLSYGGG